MKTNVVSQPNPNRILGKIGCGFDSQYTRDSSFYSRAWWSRNTFWLTQQVKNAKKIFPKRENLYVNTTNQLNRQM